MADQDTQSEARWWTLGQVVDSIREIDPAARIGDIRLALVNRCASGRDPVHTAIAGSTVSTRSSQSTTMTQVSFGFRNSMADWMRRFDEISAGEWRELAFFCTAHT